MPLQLLGPNIRDWSQSKSRRSHDHSFPEGIISGRTQKWKRGLFYDFKILLVVVILAQAFHITHQYLFLKFAEAWPEAEKSLTEFSADRGVAAFKLSIKPRLNKSKFGSQWVCVINCMLSGREIATNTNTNVCMTIMQNVTYFTRKLCCWQMPSRYVGVLFAYFNYLLELFGFKTCWFGRSQL